MNKSGISTKINNNNIELTVHDLEQVVGYQYVLCIKSKMQINNSLLLLNDLNEQLKIMGELVASAIYKQTDFMLLQIEVQNYKSEYKMYQQEFMNNLMDLNLICGINDTMKVDLKDISLMFRLKCSQFEIFHFFQT